ncbi:ATP-binding cassette domain-containing protein [uncultured Jatrophihabitans sp.]|uniref:ATP-binding cassette domain-containing protein n=1 Tax=uncultured Jatrophihabitans sp. TaxID=1610747 RepID=UPI0035CB814A
MSIVEVTGLTKRYGATLVVDDVSLSIDEGRTLAVVGESGAGKSTIAAIVTGSTPATAGTVVVAGEDRSRWSRSTRMRRRRGRQLQLVAQDPFTSLDPRQPVGAAISEVIALHDTLDRAARRTRALELLDAVGLASSHASVYPSRLSGGQRQRVAIARALAARPAVIVLDEAVSALDVSVQAQVLNLLTELQRQTNTAYLFITHDLGVVRQIADEILVLRDGRTVEQGPADDVLISPTSPYTQELLAATPRPGWTPQRRHR